MAKFLGAFGTCMVWLAFSGTAWADEPPPTPPPPMAPMPPPRPAPVYIPTADERAMAVRASTSDCTTCPSCAPCGREACFQVRDNCGWPTDACGKRRGCLEIELQGGISWFSDPDGQLGEVVAGNTAPLNWNDLDYRFKVGGRAAVGYRYAPYHRVELRGAYYGSADDSGTRSGFFGATPGALGTGDLSRPVNATFSSEAKAWGGELNAWSEISCEGRWRTERGFGVRYLSFDETAHTSFVSTGPGPFPVANGFVDSDVTNKWYGIQGLWEVHFDVTCDVELNATFKGLLGYIQRESAVTDLSLFAGGLHGASAKDNEFVWGADVEVGARWRITPRISVSGGADFFFLDKVQRAEDALDFSHSTTGAVQAKNAPDQLVIETLYLGVVITF